MRSYIVKKNHIWLTVSEILRYRLFWRRIPPPTQKKSQKIPKLFIKYRKEAPLFDLLDFSSCKGSETPPPPQEPLEAFRGIVTSIII